VSGKGLSQRVASAAGSIRLSAETVQLVAADKIAKGNVLITAEIAGVLAAKQTAALIPLCHPLPLTGIVVECTLEPTAVCARSEVKCTDRTGVEMEALTAVTVALLTVYDMCKAVDKEMVISDIRLLRKTKRAVTHPDRAPAAAAPRLAAPRPAARKNP
jgi:cyclic pyranopterin phosphate synthase